MQRSVIDPSADRPLYRQLADVLRARIISGDRLWAAGQYLQSEADLGHEYAVSQTTVRKALGLLRAEGLVHAARGLPWQVTERQEVTVIPAGPGARVSWRLATVDDHDQHGIAEDTPVLVVSREGQPDEVHPAGAVVVEFDSEA